MVFGQHKARRRRDRYDLLQERELRFGKREPTARHCQGSRAVFRFGTVL